MTIKRPMAYALYVMGAFAFGAASVLALPPQNSPWMANYANAMLSCVRNCMSHQTIPIPPGMTPDFYCGPYCNNLLHSSPGYPATPMPSSGIPECKVSQAAIWAWYAVCKIDLAMVTQGGALAADLAQILGGNTNLANQLIGQAKGLGDPCAYVRDQALGGTPSC